MGKVNYQLIILMAEAVNIGKMWEVKYVAGLKNTIFPPIIKYYV